MAHESFLGFLEKASQDPALQEQLKGAVDAEAVASVAHAAGCIDVSAEQVASFLAEVASQQAANGDHDLAGVTGGAMSKGEKIATAATLSTLGVATIGSAVYYYATQPDSVPVIHGQGTGDNTCVQAEVTILPGFDAAISGGIGGGYRPEHFAPYLEAYRDTNSNSSL